MRMNVLLLGLLAGFGLAGQAAAQTCASPLPIGSNQTPAINPALARDLCADSNSLPSYGGVTSPHRDAVYSFVAQNANATITIANTGGAWGDANPTVVLMPSPCSSSTDILNAGDSTTPMGPLSGLVNGQTYYIIVTADPGNPDPNRCGTYSLNVQNILPVELQSFSVD